MQTLMKHKYNVMVLMHWIQRKLCSLKKTNSWIFFFFSISLKNKFVLPHFTLNELCMHLPHFWHTHTPKKSNSLIFAFVAVVQKYTDTFFKERYLLKYHPTLEKGCQMNHSAHSKIKRIIYYQSQAVEQN